MRRLARKAAYQPDQGTDIVERHACRDGVEVALVAAPEGSAEAGMFAFVLIYPGPDRKPVRRVLVGWLNDRERMASRMMDAQAAVCAMQWAGFALPAAPTTGDTA